jgi:hypothetical protein
LEEDQPAKKEKFNTELWKVENEKIRLKFQKVNQDILYAQNLPFTPKEIS